MSYYYQSHIRNLEDESIIERRKIAAELHEQDLLKQSNRTTQPSSSNQPSRKIQNAQMTAYLERSRLSAELSAMRAKAESSMNRSRLESAFELRKENQRAQQTLDTMDRRHAFQIEQRKREEEETRLRMMASQREAEESARQQMLMHDLSYRQSLRNEEELNSAHRLTRILRDRYYY